MIQQQEQQYTKGRFRNTAFVIEKTRPIFDAAYEAQVMGVYGRSLDNRHVRLRNEKYITDFVRCSYLGLDNHPDIVNGALSAILEYHSVHWSCARTRLNFGLLLDLEDRLSDLFRSRVIAFSTVMVANMGILPLIASGHLTGGVKPIMVFDRLCHASLAFHKAVVADETEVVTIAHNDVNELEDICKINRLVAYISDGVYSMGGNAPIKELRELQDRYNLFLYIDDAHGISIVGKRGEGFARSQFREELGPSTIIAASLAKGFGASGGILMLGTKEQEDICRRYSQPYVFSAAPNLAAIGAALASARLHSTPELWERQAALADRIRLFDRRMATPDKGNMLPIRMIPIGEETAAIESARRLLERGFYTSATFFPTVARGAAGLRVCLTATHSFDEIERLCMLVNRVREEVSRTTEGI